MSRNKTVFLLSTLFMLLSACQSGVSPTAEATSSATPTATNTPTSTNNDIYKIKPSTTRLTQTTILTPTNNDFNETEIFTPLNVDLSSFEEKGLEGNIWVIQRSSNLTRIKMLSLLSLNKMMMAEEIQIPSQCIGMIPWKSTVICADTGELFQYNLDDNQVIDLNFKSNYISTEIFESSHTVTINTVSDGYEFIYINNETGEVIKFTLVEEDIFARPQISKNGRFIAYIEFGSEGYQLVILDNDTLESKIVSTPDQNLTRLFLWSPDNRFLLYGATSYVSEIVSNSDQLYIYDREIDETILLIESPEDSEFNDAVFYQSVSIWSPDSKFVAVVQPFTQTDEPLFIIHLINSDQVCYSIKVSSLAWSPDSKFIAFFSYDYKEPTSISINILDIESGEIILIYENEYLERNTVVNWTD